MLETIEFCDGYNSYQGSEKEVKNTRKRHRPPAAPDSNDWPVDVRRGACAEPRRR